jgi:hypothetical protein
MVKNYSVVVVPGAATSRAIELVRGAFDDLMRLYRSGVVKPLVTRGRAPGAREALVELAEGRRQQDRRADP